MDVRYFESLICVAELGSIAQAARVQHLTAAAIGQRISVLEEHFGAVLLDRSSRNATPSESCLKLLPHARKLVSDFQAMHAILESSGLSGRFRLGTIPTALTGLLPRAIRRLAKLAPKLALEIVPGTSESIYSALGERKIDAGVFALPPFKLPSRFSVEVIRKEPLVLLSKKGSGKTIREKLINNPYVCFDSKSWAGGGAVKYLKDQKIHIQPSYELDALEPIEKIVQEGMGVTLVPQWSGLDLQAADLEFDVIQNDRYSRKVAFVSPNNSSHPKVISLLHEALLVDLK